MFLLCEIGLLLLLMTLMKATQNQRWLWTKHGGFRRWILHILLEISSLDLEIEILSHCVALLPLIVYKVINGLYFSTGCLWAWTCSGCFTGQDELLSISETSSLLYFSWRTFVIVGLYQGKRDCAPAWVERRTWTFLCVSICWRPLLESASVYCRSSTEYILYYTSYLAFLRELCYHEGNSQRLGLKIWNSKKHFNETFMNHTYTRRHTASGLWKRRATCNRS